MEDYNWLEYNDNIYLLDPLDDYMDINYQFDGTSCLQAAFTCSVVKKWKSKSKYFNENFWYSKTSWGVNYPSKIFFGSTVSKGKMQELYDLAWGLNQELIDTIVEKTAKPAEKVLKAILKNAIKHTGIKLFFEYDNTDYGVHWWEANVPVIDEKGKHYIITWQNCD